MAAVNNGKLKSISEATAIERLFIPFPLSSEFAEELIEPACLA
jgi:hypothetical protein